MGTSYVLYREGGITCPYHGVTNVPELRQQVDAAAPNHPRIRALRRGDMFSIGKDVYEMTSSNDARWVAGGPAGDGMVASWIE